MSRAFLCRCGSMQGMFAINDADAVFVGWGCSECEESVLARHRRDMALAHAEQDRRAAQAAPPAPSPPPPAPSIPPRGMLAPPLARRRGR